MRKLIFICVICIATIQASLLHPTKNKLDGHREKKEDHGENKHASKETEPSTNSTEPVTPATVVPCEADAKLVDSHPRIAETKSNDENDEESNEVHSKERRPSLVERLIHHKDIKDDKDNSHEGREPIPCTCGVFLSGQFKKGSKKQPKGLPVLTQEMDTPFMNNAVGNRQCTNKCLELIIKHLPKSSEIICATVDRESVFKERAYLFIKNHSDKWHGTNLSAGREFCCEDNVPYKCPVS